MVGILGSGYMTHSCSSNGAFFLVRQLMLWVLLPQYQPFGAYKHANFFIETI